MYISFVRPWESGLQIGEVKDNQVLFGSKKKSKICMCKIVCQVGSHDLKDEGHKMVIVAESCHLNVLDQRNNFVDKI